MENNDKKNIFTRRSFLKGLGIGTVAVGASTITGCAGGEQHDTQQEPPIGKMTCRSWATA